MYIKAGLKSDLLPMFLVNEMNFLLSSFCDSINVITCTFSDSINVITCCLHNFININVATRTCFDRGGDPQAIQLLRKK